MAQSNQEFERLKQKYQPVLNLMKQLQVQVQNVNVDGTKLFIRVNQAGEREDDFADSFPRLHKCPTEYRQQSPQPAIGRLE